MDEETEDLEKEVEEQLFNRKPKPSLSISEGVEAMRDAGLTEEEVSEWVEGKVHKKFGFKPKQEK